MRISYSNLDAHARMRAFLLGPQGRGALLLLQPLDSGGKEIGLTIDFGDAKIDSVQDAWGVTFDHLRSMFGIAPDSQVRTGSYSYEVKDGHTLTLTGHGRSIEAFAVLLDRAPAPEALLGCCEEVYFQSAQIMDSRWKCSEVPAEIRAKLPGLVQAYLVPGKPLVLAQVGEGCHHC